MQRFSRSIVWAVSVCAVSACGLAFCAPEAQGAQSAFNYVGVSNDNSTTNNGKWADFVDTGNGSGLPEETEFAESFTGTDQSGSSRTMSFSGQLQSWSQWGVLKTSVNASVDNAFYNDEANAPYYDVNTSQINTAGVPDIFNAEATAAFSERLIYGGTATNYTSRYYFRLTGSIGGDGTYTHVLVRHGTNTTERYFFSNDGDYDQIIATSTYVNSGNEFFSVTIQSGFLAGIDYVEDGDSLSGFANFGNTLELIAVEARDDTGALLPEGSVVGEQSGMSYVVAPEPGSLALMAMAGLMALRRRRR